MRKILAMLLMLAVMTGSCYAQPWQDTYARPFGELKDYVGGGLIQDGIPMQLTAGQNVVDVKGSCSVYLESVEAGDPDWEHLVTYLFRYRTELSAEISTVSTDWSADLDFHDLLFVDGETGTILDAEPVTRERPLADLTYWGASGENLLTKPSSYRTGTGPETITVWKITCGGVEQSRSGKQVKLSGNVETLVIMKVPENYTQLLAVAYPGSDCFQAGRLVLPTQGEDIDTGVFFHADRAYLK